MSSNYVRTFLSETSAQSKLNLV